jgi:hypothetical protein
MGVKNHRVSKLSALIRREVVALHLALAYGFEGRKAEMLAGRRARRGARPLRRQPEALSVALIMVA